MARAAGGSLGSWGQAGIAAMISVAATGLSLALVAFLGRPEPAEPPRSRSTPPPIELSASPEPTPRPEPVESPPTPAAQAAAPARPDPLTRPSLDTSPLTDAGALAAPGLGGLAVLPTLGTGLGAGPAATPTTGTAPSKRPETTAKPLRRPPPRYPAQARRDGIEGFAVVRLRVDARGRVIDAVVVRADPPNIFDTAARDAARRYRFQPAMRDGRAIPTTIEQRIVFRLQ